MERNRRATGPLSPTLMLFLEPHGKLYVKLQQGLAQLQISATDLPPLAAKRRPGPAKPKHGIPPIERPNVVRRVVENTEPLRSVAKDYGVSHETVRRVILSGQKSRMRAE